MNLSTNVRQMFTETKQNRLVLCEKWTIFLGERSRLKCECGRGGGGDLGYFGGGGGLSGFMIWEGFGTEQKIFRFQIFRVGFFAFCMWKHVFISYYYF